MPKQQYGSEHMVKRRPDIIIDDTLRSLHILAYHIDLTFRPILTNHAECQNGVKSYLNIDIWCIYDFVALNGVISVTNTQLRAKRSNSLRTNTHVVLIVV